MFFFSIQASNLQDMQDEVKCLVLLSKVHYKSGSLDRAISTLAKAREMQIR